MKKINLILLLMFICSSVMAQQVNFIKDMTWSQVLAKAKKDGKSIFIDAYTTWCGPCKQMDADVFSQSTVGNFFNQWFISVKVQMDSTKLDSEYTRSWYADANKMMKEYSVNVFPTFLFLSSDGDLLHRVSGALNSGLLIDEAQKSYDPNNQYFALFRKYQSSDRQPSFIRNLARKASEVGRKAEADKVAKEYVNSLKPDSLYTLDNIWFMYEFMKRPSDRSFLLFEKDLSRISKIEPRLSHEHLELRLMSILNDYYVVPHEKTNGGKADWKTITANLAKYDALGRKVLEVYSPKIVFNDEIKPLLNSKNGKADWDQIKINLNGYGQLGQDTYTKFLPSIILESEIRPYIATNKSIQVWDSLEVAVKRFGKDGEEVFLKAKTFEASTTNNIDLLLSGANSYINKFKEKLNGETINNWAWCVFQKSDDRTQLQTALEWSQLALEKEDHPNIMDTHANILYKLGRQKEAIEWQEKAVSLMKDDPNFQKTLDRMKAGQETWLNN